jgi:hypothetical protein
LRKAASGVFISALVTVAGRIYTEETIENAQEKALKMTPGLKGKS